ncbi:cleavage and polyadenylation specificity factor subunit 5 [Anaeramoeba flamelloides]|uniref:Cleavage and polyadenylation specificity factor subunit 5 n=1 Tax=Anaeramoeba flamelloides TaxID=1746091 RepID=A0ABQ8YY87_9EUKA|nr:cleavage and polyadenylation specificity factor subunit 5 [Anaeramoeba flamelloides]
MIDLYENSCYTISTKEPIKKEEEEKESEKKEIEKENKNENEKDNSENARLKKLKQKYEKQGMRRSVCGVLIAHQFEFPHILLLETNDVYELPGGVLKASEGEVEGLKRKLNKYLAKKNQKIDWDIGELLCNWWQPNFNGKMYPYIPAHITKVKECKKMFLVNLPEEIDFCIFSGSKLYAVPLCDLYENTKKFGNVISALPNILGRFEFIFN